MNTKLPHSAVILCGGQSRRMGFNKALLPINDEDFLDRIIASLSGFDELILSVGSNQSPDRELPFVRDIFPDCGPLAGIHAALGSCRHQLLFVTACDAPLVDLAIAQGLLALLEPQYDAVVPIDVTGRMHPLCAAYSKHCLAIMEKQLMAHEYRLRDTLALLKVLYVPAEQLPGAERKLLNINTLEEYKSFIHET